ncbi:hypothetical protein DPMN_062204 [Dreissena polymorpha]|uniref:Uncharacterized protein n=1 Tax=Dreissena polymorpha TaxID=45954 RepID=A0A9D4HHX2_DREPO|nr:hypothetical protein DPMN_062204 [Dreissena polymorpha]
MPCCHPGDGLRKNVVAQKYQKATDRPGSFRFFDRGNPGRSAGTSVSIRAYRELEL